jgi:hypothetical protein
VTHRASPKRIERELDRLEEQGDLFNLRITAYNLHVTPQKLAAELRARENAVCVTQRTGRDSGGNYSEWKFIKGENK